MPSRGFAAAQAVTSTIVSPQRTTTAPSACFASRPGFDRDGVSANRDCSCVHVPVFSCELRQLPVDVHARPSAARVSGGRSRSAHPAA